MKTLLQPSIWFLAAAGFCSAAQAQTSPGDTAEASSTGAPIIVTLPSGPPPARFATFESASASIIASVAQAQAIATTARATTVQLQGQLTGVTPPPPLSSAVSQAGAAIVQEGRVVRSDALAERQAALTRLRLAQSQTDRVRLMTELREQSGQRMEEQREVARQVRDRLRELRNTTTLTPRSGN